MDQLLCNLCGKSFQAVRALKKHHKDIHIEVLTSCSQCNKTFKSHKQLENHLNTHKTIVCIGCNKEIPKNSKSSHVCGENHPIFKCDQCDYETNQKCNLQRHNKVHNKKPKDDVFNCHLCPKTFTRKNNMKVHVQTHSNKVVCETMETQVLTQSKKEKNKVFVCEVCDKCFSYQRTLNVHTEQQHVKKKVSFSGGFAMLEENKPKVFVNEFSCDKCDYKSKRKADLKKHRQRVHREKPPKSTKCDQCDYESTNSSHLKRHMAEVKHKVEQSRSTKYRHKSKLTEELHCRIMKKEDPITVFGEKEVAILVEDCKGSIRDLLRMIKWMRHCFGSKHFAPHIREMIKKHFNKLDYLHEAETVTAKDKDNCDIQTVLSKVADVSTFVSEIAQIRKIQQPKLILGCDGGQNKLVVNAIIKENDDSDDEDSIFKEARATGSKRVLCLGKIDGVPENRENVELLLYSLDLHLLPDDWQLVCDLKLTGIINGIQSCSSVYGCPFCDGCKVDEEGKPTGGRGKWVRGKLRNISNITENNVMFLKNGGNKKHVKKFKSCLLKPIKLTNGKDDTPVLVQFPLDPLHVVLLGPVNDILAVLEKKYPDVMIQFYSEHSLTKKGQGIGGTFNGPSIKDILKEKNLNHLGSLLPPECETAIDYMKNLREIHRICLAKNVDPDSQLILSEYERNFDILYKEKLLNMTLKNHVISHHIQQYFDLTNTTMKDTNGEFVETLHSTLRKHEENHGFKVVRRLGSPSHLKNSLASHVSHNSLRAGFVPSRDFGIRTPSPHPIKNSPNVM